MRPTDTNGRFQLSGIKSIPPALKIKRNICTLSRSEIGTTVSARIGFNSIRLSAPLTARTAPITSLCAVWDGYFCLPSLCALGRFIWTPLGRCRGKPHPRVLSRARIKTCTLATYIFCIMKDVGKMSVATPSCDQLSSRWYKWRTCQYFIADVWHTEEVGEKGILKTRRKTNC